MNWLFPALIATLSWGVWGLAMRFASQHYEWHQTLILSSFWTFIFAMVIGFWFTSGIVFDSTGLWFTIAAGFFGSLAVAGFQSALELGKTSIIVPLTALYPVVTVVLSVIFLKEGVTALQGMGIALAIVSTLLMSLE